jgi:hypothetical protein
MDIEILEEAAGLVAQNFYELKTGTRDIAQNQQAFDEALADTIFVINNFMRVSSNIAMTRESKDNLDTV